MANGMERERAVKISERPATRIGYARVSTEDQNLALQIDALKAAGCTRILCDEGVSGVAVSRPALSKALAALRSGDVLVTWKLDRLGRSLAHLIEIIGMLENRHVGFRSLSEAIDTTTPGGMLIFHVMGALAQFERALISERTRAGMAASRARGGRLGRPRKLTDAQEDEIRRLSADQRDVAGLARRFEVSPSTISRVLVGCMCEGGG